jgi:hypothetical protein
MKRASYRDAVAWIALNDEPSERDLGFIADQISVVLIADVMNVDPHRIARDVIRYREKHK